uniref:FAD dependent monooxygenase n=2 Tax=Epichloe bromicola TaxID=79588 RepID=A0A3G1K0L2_9HYPO|nr:FAD dependent monooxygenase [Epichloe bromicola]
MTGDFKVIIVGGSVAGLSLAHCLEKIGVSFVVLEKGNQIAPQLGASIGILPNGGRILDQLGIFHSIEDEIEPLESAMIRYPDGFSFKSQYPRALHTSFGYPVSFLERQRFLQILYDKLRSKDCVFTKKRVVCIASGQDKVIAKTSDGVEYSADVVIGADGVHSIVRSEIWRHLTKNSQISESEAPNASIKHDYSCIYGMSLNVPQIIPGIQLSCLDDGVSIHLFTGKKSKLFWFVIIKTPQTSFAKVKIDDTHTARCICEGLRTKKVSDTLFFEDVWSRCTIFKMTPLEEGVFKHWNYGRLACIGDAIRKMAPNIGQGANMAIEDACSLANLLQKKISHGLKRDQDINLMFQEFSTTQRARTESVCAQSEFLVRMHANQGIGRRLLGRYLIPFLYDAPAGLSGFSISGATRIEFIDLPARSLRGAWGKSWGGSWKFILQSLAYLRPKFRIVHALYFVAALILFYLNSLFP